MAALDADQKEGEVRNQQLNQAYDQILKLQSQVDRERDKWIELSVKITALSEQLQMEIHARKRAEWDKCVITGCPLRNPPRKNETIHIEQNKQE